MWFVVHFVNAVVLYYIILSAWDNFTITPLVTSLFDTLYPIKLVSFPGIAICNNNRISKRAAYEYALEL